ncbi:hypothetical protein H4J58_06315 [Colwellia sp. MB3u-70]|uniref:hypothetical protein n=1 Tax=unclassified Colwellia TaxID=196834 RepID=UPI0015F3696A|nr:MULTISPECIES: hypothetical protein [unclassified Colwellia]MBA6293780.1 hypothetical protein [Colwellia sp. MB3u-8]MBA6306728.1 hypothetical protein [Colwellia sp. MB3u-70]
MDNMKFVNEIKEECLDELIPHFVELLSTRNPVSFNDPTMHDLATAWQASDEKTKEIFKKLMYLSSQGSIASTLHLIDTQFTMEVNTDHLVVGDLLDLFMAQTETSESGK